VEESASKKEIIEMRTRLKHAENGAKSGKPECVQIKVKTS